MAAGRLGLYVGRSTTEELMAILSGAMTVSRLRVVEPELHEGWRELYRDRLDEHAFVQPPQGISNEEVEGWTQVHNLLDTDFADFNQWLYGDFAVFALRVDKKRIPANLFKATLEKKCQEVAKEMGVDKIGASRRTAIRDELEKDFLAQTLPTIRVTEAAWCLSQGWVIVHSHSDATLDRFRKRFFRTFGKKLVPWSPLDFMGTSSEVEQLLSMGGSALTSPGGEA